MVITRTGEEEIRGSLNGSFLIEGKGERGEGTNALRFWKNVPKTKQRTKRNIKTSHKIDEQEGHPKKKKGENKDGKSK